MSGKPIPPYGSSDIKDTKDDGTVLKIDNPGQDAALARTGSQASLSAMEEIAAIERTEENRIKAGGEKEIDEGDVIAEGEET